MQVEKRKKSDSEVWLGLDKVFCVTGDLQLRRNWGDFLFYITFGCIDQRNQGDAQFPA